ncbi:hypothetical protein JAAARDRAFT_122067 [Jaapia argillacea MUCL 33604]|uniref:3-beta hydroxysteroid dehydrogenase/isomerase domain-containing protein n=1 Tax=Jaapia argillacea MUCL 33604 TaxID=933084 RepID=A0A067QIE7_9AGAM|nr:hypothetical protein JAAARDRAFT_122067 [Jaapia argillacea MUCL 33604]
MSVLAYPSILCGGIALYLSLLSRRLRTPHPSSHPELPPNPQELDAVSYAGVDMLKGIPAKPTHAGYAIIGGSGYVGTYIVRLLLLRGETTVRVIDLRPPREDILSHPSVSFVDADITKAESIKTALLAPFPSTGSPPTVIFHTAAIIRFWDRASYTWDLSHQINVIGTRNVLEAAKELPQGTILVYTSTADTAIPRTRFMRLSSDYGNYPWNKLVISDDDPPLTGAALSDCCYTRSKQLAEDLVVVCDGINALRIGILRPGYTIMGPNDRLITAALTMPTVPIFDEVYSHTNVCVWDIAAAHLVYEKALQDSPDAVRGQKFLVSGSGPAWRLRDTRNTVKHYSSRPLTFTPVPPLLIYILAHFIEAFLYLRYHILYPIYSLVYGTTPSLSPRWMDELLLLQPTTFAYMADVVIDDSRARKLLGYKPQWTTLQCIRYTVEQYESGKSGDASGLRSDSFHTTMSRSDIGKS